MKNLYKLVILLAFFSCNRGIDNTVMLMTFNIRLDTEKDGENRWDKRKESMINLLNNYKPSIIGIQEGLPHQVEYLDSALKNYAFIGVGRDNGRKEGEFSAIFYDSLLFKVTNSSTFWLSEFPDSVSFGWDAACRRICTYGLFESRSTHQQFWVFNTHFDHVGSVAREKSAQLILSKIKELNRNGFPVVLMGDFNSTNESKAVQSICFEMNDSYTISDEQPNGPKGTFNGFNPSILPVDRIDYIFVSGFRVSSYYNIDDRRNDGFFISDHFPVLVELQN